MRKLVCIEGANGVGKSIIIDQVTQRLKQREISSRLFKDSEFPQMIEARRRVREKGKRI